MLSTDLQSHFLIARRAEWKGPGMATLHLPYALPHMVSPAFGPEAAAAGGFASSDPGWWPVRANFSAGAVLFSLEIHLEICRFRKMHIMRLISEKRDLDSVTRFPVITFCAQRSRGLVKNGLLELRSNWVQRRQPQR